MGYQPSGWPPTGPPSKLVLWLQTALATFCFLWVLASIVLLPWGLMAYARVIGWTFEATYRWEQELMTEIEIEQQRRFDEERMIRQWDEEEDAP